MMATDGTPDPSVAQGASEAETQGSHQDDEASRVVDGNFGDVESVGDDKTAASVVSTSSNKTGASSSSSSISVGVPVSNFIGPTPAPTAANLQTNQRFNINH